MQIDLKSKKKENLQLFEPKQIPVNIVKKEEKVELSIEEVEKIFDALDDIRKIEIEQKALEICEKQEGVSQQFLLKLKKSSEIIYKSTIIKFIAEVLSEKAV